MENFDESGLKRYIRVLNSIINLYDIETIPSAFVDVLYEPVAKVVGILGLAPLTKTERVDGKEVEVVDKFVMPDDFERWLETRGELHT